MVRINVSKVKGKMAERKISRSTLSSYLECPEKIPYSIIASMADMLCDNADEAGSIFFASDLRNT